MNPKITLSMAVKAIEQIEEKIYLIESVYEDKRLTGADFAEIHSATQILTNYCLDTDTPSPAVISKAAILVNALNRIGETYQYMREEQSAHIYGVDSELFLLAERLEGITKYRPELTAPNKQPTPGKQPGVNLPNELDTPEARKYFTRAIEAGFMEQTATGYKWIFGGNKGQVRLGYFCQKVFKQPRPIYELEKLFGKQRLGASITQSGCTPGRLDVIKWRNEIDNAIFFD